MKIQIIGYSGSGKSTLAEMLGDFYKIKVLHLDNTHFYGDWKERTKEEQEQLINQFLENNDDWVIDGNYCSISPIRFEVSDITIFLSYNRLYCYKMCKRRFKKYKGTAKSSCPCEEKFDWEFKSWILYYGRTNNKKKKMLSCLNKTQGKKLLFKNKKQLNKWLIEIGYYQ